MDRLTHHDVTMLLIALGVLLAVARAGGELARRLHQPAVIGEIMAGIVLGPTVLGALWPQGAEALFPRQGARTVVLDGFMTVSVVLFLLVAGLEVDLSTIWRRRMAALTVGLGGMIVPFGLGFALAWVAPSALGAGEAASPLVFALFLGTAMAISALPVIARILLDLQLFRTDLGMTIVAAAVFNDLTGWLIFAMILAMIGRSGGAELQAWQSIVLTLVFVAVMLSAGRWLIDRVLPWLQAHLSWPGGVLGFALSLTILCAAFTEYIGVHAIFGAFIFGVALGDSRHLRANTRETIDQFVSFIFAPIFFAGIGLRVDFLAHFDIVLVLVTLLIATVGKVLGCAAAARLGRLPRREAWAIGFGMNARGVMEIILGLLALEFGVIDERLFVALTVMALVTSMSSGALMQLALGRTKRRQFWTYASAKAFVPALESTDRLGAIRELSEALSRATGLDAGAVAASAAARERILPSGISGGVAAPHARMAGLKEPAVAVGIAPGGIDFDARDGLPGRLVILLVTPLGDVEAQLEMLASVAHLCHDDSTVQRLLEATSWTEFLATINADATIPS